MSRSISIESDLNKFPEIKHHNTNSTKSFKSSANVFQKQLHDAFYGLMNGVMVVPVMISFASIIFRDQSFQASLPILVKLVLFSSLIHQFSFSLLSSLPYAIGQVQDAGLIFLSAMSGSIAHNLIETPERILPTCLFIMSMSTFSLGFALVGIGRLKLASVVQYIPMPVVGGYLAYIGSFCFQASLEMMAGISIATPTDWYKLISLHHFLLVLPGVGCGVVIFVLLPIFKSPAVLPISLSLMILMFYFISTVAGIDVEQSRSSGWVAPLTPAVEWYKIWQDFTPSLVDWGQVPEQASRWAAMVAVVGFSSCLDVAAIEMETSAALDYNRELQTVGWSNVFSGLSGGFTGSYIFTQTIFSLRRGVTSRICGFVAGLFELLVVLMPVPITCYIPKFVFGSLLVLIAADLSIEWLVHARLKMTHTEYAVCLSTFISMQMFGVQMGLAIGIVLSLCLFTITYASSPTVSVSTLQQSRAVRSYQDRCKLINCRGAIVKVKPQGYVFFGTAIKLLEEVKRHVLREYSQQPHYSAHSHLVAENETTLLLPSTNTAIIETKAVPTYITPIGHTLSRRNSLNSAPQRVKFVVMDFTYVIGVDATAARACFLLLSGLLKASGVIVVYTQMSESVEKLLRAHGVIADDPNDSQVEMNSPHSHGHKRNCVVIPSLDDALEWCEECLLDRMSSKYTSVVGGGLEAGAPVLSTNDCETWPSSLSRSASSQRKVQPSLYIDRHRNRQQSQERLRSFSVAQRSNGSSTKSQLDTSSQHQPRSPLSLSPSSSEKTKKALNISNINAFNAIDAEEDWAPGLEQGSNSKFQHQLDEAPSTIGNIGNLVDMLDSYLLSEEQYYCVSSNSKAVVPSKLSFFKEKLNKYFTRMVYPSGYTFFEQGEEATLLFILEKGSVEIVADTDIADVYSNKGISSSESVLAPVERVYKMSAGSIFGEPEFVLKKPYSTRCYALSYASVWTVSQRSFQSMQIEDPALYSLLQQVLLRSLSVTQISSTFHLHPSSAYHIVFRPEKSTTANSIYDE